MSIIKGERSIESYWHIVSWANTTSTQCTHCTNFLVIFIFQSRTVMRDSNAVTNSHDNQQYSISDRSFWLYLAFTMFQNKCSISNLHLVATKKIILIHKLVPSTYNAANMKTLLYRALKLYSKMHENILYYIIYCFKTIVYYHSFPKLYFLQPLGLVV